MRGSQNLVLVMTLAAALAGCRSSPDNDAEGSSISAARIEFETTGVNITSLTIDAGRNNSIVSVALQAGVSPVPENLEQVRDTGQPLHLETQSFVGEQKYELLRSHIENEPGTAGVAHYTVVVVVSYLERWLAWSDTLSLDVWVGTPENTAVGGRKLCFKKLDL